MRLLDDLVAPLVMILPCLMIRTLMMSPGLPCSTSLGSMTSSVAPCSRRDNWRLYPSETGLLQLHSSHLSSPNRALNWIDCNPAAPEPYCRGPAEM